MSIAFAASSSSVPAIEGVIPGVSCPDHPRTVLAAGVTSDLGRGVAEGVSSLVFLLFLLPRPGVDACISFLPASSIHIELFDSNAARYSLCASLSSRPGK